MNLKWSLVLVALDLLCQHVATACRENFELAVHEDDEQLMLLDLDCSNQTEVPAVLLVDNDILYAYNSRLVKVSGLTSNIHTAYFTSNKLKSVDVSKSINLIDLELHANEIESFNDLKLPEGLETLDVGENPIKTFKGAKFPSTLTSLAIDTTNITTLMDAPTELLQTLTDLTISQYMAGFPEAIPNLVSVGLVGNKIQSLQPIASLSLKELFLEDVVAIKSLKELKNTTSITGLTLNRVPLDTLENISLPNLENLAIGYGYVPGVPTMDGYQNLKTLTLNDIPFKQFPEAITPFPSDLTSVNLINLELTSFDQLNTLPSNLQTLSLFGNQFTDDIPTDAIADLSDLEYFIIGGKFEDLEGLQLPRQLKYIRLKAEDTPINTKQGLRIRGLDFPPTMKYISIEGAHVVLFVIPQRNVDTFSSMKLFGIHEFDGMSSLERDELCQVQEQGKWQDIQGKPFCVVDDTIFDERYPLALSKEVKAQKTNAWVHTLVVLGIATVIACVVFVVIWRKKMAAYNAALEKQNLI